MRTSALLRLDGSGGVEAAFTIEEGESVDVMLEWNGEVRPLLTGETQELFDRTADFWERWLSHSRYQGRWREMVHRSALTLKLLVYHPTGALIAAPTTSLPEAIGGARNWDYRYSWLRDAAFTIYSLMTLGFLDEAAAFMEWIQQRCELADPERDLMIMYTVDGRTGITETTLDHLEGYRGSRPVRLGNSAVGQRQLDVYGELMDLTWR